nr:PelD GGDEF domain-containing protein [Variovorax terrae]
MPFTALTGENLQTVAVLLESYADYLRLTRQAGDLTTLWPAAPRGLAGEFAWLARLRGEYGLESHCVVWRAQHERQQDIIEEIQQLHSRGETAWHWPTERGDANLTPCIIALVPFASPAAVRVYKHRIMHGVQRVFGDLPANQLLAFDFAISDEAMFGNLRSVVESLG